MKYLLSIISLFFLLSVVLTPAHGQQVIRISGATTVQPVVELIAEQFTQLTGQRFAVQGGGSLTGAQDVMEGDSHLGMVSRSLSPFEKERLEYVTLGLDALVFIVNERNPLNEINLETVTALFTGQVVNWNELIDWDREVVLVSKEMGRSTLELFEEYSGLHHRDNSSPGKNGYVSGRAYEIGSNLDGITLVGGVPGAVGYMSLGTTIYLMEKGMPVKILKLNGLIAGKEYIIKGKYPITRELNLVYLKENEELVSEFIEYCQGPKAQEIVLELKYFPVK